MESGSLVCLFLNQEMFATHLQGIRIIKFRDFLAPILRRDTR